MDVLFAFADESVNRRLTPPLSSFTGLLVRPDQYDELRLRFYQALEREIQPEPRVVNPHPPELHFREFLPDASDARRVEVLSRLAELVSSLKLSIVRVGYFVTPRLQQIFRPDRDLHGLAWIGLKGALAPATQNALVVPVVDAGFSEGFQSTVQSYSGSAQATDVMRSAGLDPGIEGWDFSSQMEILWADSRFSAPLQLVDVVSGLRGLVDTERVQPGYTFSEFKAKLLPLGHLLDESMLVDAIIAMTSDGVAQGPAEFAGGA